jgi:hypothetical protein
LPCAATLGQAAFHRRALRNDFTARWHGREGKLAGAIDAIARRMAALFKNSKK